MKLLLLQLGEVNKVLSLFKNDLKQLKNVIVIFISCLLLNYLIGTMSFDKDIISDPVPVKWTHKINKIDDPIGIMIGFLSCLVIHDTLLFLD